MDKSIVNFKFENLNVWQKAIEYAQLIYEISQNFPKAEVFGLQSQIRRSAISVSLNIAEGSGRTTKKEFRKFLHVSLGSLRESVTCLHLALKLEYINKDDFDRTYEIAVSISKMLYRLEQSLND